MQANFIIESGSEDGGDMHSANMGFPSPANVETDDLIAPFHAAPPDGMFRRVNDEDIIFNPPKEPKIIGKYLFGESLGEGSYGKVKEVLDIETLQRKAVKILKQRRLRKIPHGKENVQREILMMKRLNHKNVILMYDVMHCKERDKMYIVLELCQSSLQDVLESAKGRKLPAWQANKYFVQLVDGLEYLHGQGVIHKDIKPGNLLLTVNEILKITDFGVAEMLDKSAPNDTCTISQGSPLFQPPEIADGFNEFSGFKVDVWAAGTTLFNIMTGTYPFEGENVFLLFENIVKEPLKIPDECDALLTDLLKGMLEKNAAQRFTVQQVKVHDWCRKKHSRSLDRVLIPRRSQEDSLFSMTTIPHLELLCQQMTTGGSARSSPRPGGSFNHAADTQNSLDRNVTAQQTIDLPPLEPEAEQTPAARADSPTHGASSAAHGVPKSEGKKADKKKAKSKSKCTQS